VEQHHWAQHKTQHFSERGQSLTIVASNLQQFNRKQSSAAQNHFDAGKRRRFHHATHKVLPAAFLFHKI
jgi:hypothetical protein